MTKSTIASLIFGASIGFALLKFYSMPEEDKQDFFDHLKKTTNDLLDDAETTVEKVEHYVDEIKLKGENKWVEKLYVLKKMFTDFYGTERKYLL
jgi:phage-related protein